MGKFKDDLKVIILIDWDGPISNFRTRLMPKDADPVAVNLLNRFFYAGAEAVLTSTIRKHFRGIDPKSEGTERMNSAGIAVKWYESDMCDDAWRTCPDYTGRRHDEFMKWFHQRTPLEPNPNLVFIAFDDETFPDSVKKVHNIIQPKIDINNGITYLGVSELKDFLKQNARY